MAKEERICCIEGCGKRHFGRGWCKAHYSRWRLHGAPLAGRTFRGEALTFFHDVVLPYVGNDCLIWPFYRGSNGYGHLTIDGVPKLVHRLACEQVNGRPPSPDHHASHSCGKGTSGCVAPLHLSWKLPAANIADKHIHGTDPRGSRNAQSALKEADIPIIRALKGKKTQKEIANLFGVSKSTIGMVQTGATWGHVG